MSGQIQYSDLDIIDLENPEIERNGKHYRLARIFDSANSHGNIYRHFEFIAQDGSIWTDSELMPDRSLDTEPDFVAQEICRFR